MDPIATMTRLAGEAATIVAPKTTKGYDPTLDPNYAPDGPIRTPVRGFEGGYSIGTAGDEQLPLGAKAAITISTKAVPIGLNPEGTKLEWRGQTWTVMSYSPRYFMGKMNGVTLILGA